MGLKIAQFSDTHAEFRKDREKYLRKIRKWVKDTNPDVVAAVGDNDKASHLPMFFQDVLPSRNDADIPYVFFVTGNHEYYEAGKSIDKVNEELHQWVENDTLDKQGRQFIFLDNSSHTIEKDGVSFRFSGGTLWTDMNLFGDQVTASRHAQNRLNDYRFITGKGGVNPITPAETVERHNDTMWYLESVMSGTHGQADVDIIMTHHQPTLKTCLDRFKDDPCTPCFASNLDSFIKKNDIALWIAGHSHGAKSVFMDGTFVSNNTLGYPGELENTGVRLIELNYDGTSKTTSIVL